MLQISEYNDLAAVADIRELWRELWWKTPKASFFQSVEWFEHHCRTAVDTERPHVLVISLDDRPVGLVPWVARSVRSGFGRASVLTAPLAQQGFFRGPLGNRPQMVLDAALRHAESRGDLDRLELRHIEFHRDFDITEPDPPCALPATYTIENSWAFVECHGDWVRYLRTRPTRVREAYRQSEQLLAAKGQVEYLRYRPEGAPFGDADPRWNLFQEVEQLEEEIRRERAAGRPVKAANDGWLLRELHDAATAVAGLDLNLLRLDGRPIAWAYNYRCDGRIEMKCLHATGQLAAAASCVLLGRMLHDGFRRGDESYLFDSDTTRTARGWQTGHATSHRTNHRSTRLMRLLSNFSRGGHCC